MSKLVNLEFNASELSRPSVIILILANLMPVYGVLFLKWEVFPILLLYWSENVIIGIFNILKMVISSPSKAEKWVAKLFMVPFFTVHYGIFTLVHGIFIFVLFGGVVLKETDIPDPNMILQIFGSYDLFWGFISLFLSHGVSFVLNYIGKGEYKQSGLSNLMMQPYGRIFILHVTIIFGGLLVSTLGSPIGGLLLLVMLKIAIDIMTHVKLHFGNSRTTVSESAIKAS